MNSFDCFVSTGKFPEVMIKLERLELHETMYIVPNKPESFSDPNYSVGCKRKGCPPKKSQINIPDEETTEVKEEVIEDDELQKLGNEPKKPKLIQEKDFKVL